MFDLANLIIGVDSRQAKTAATDLDRLRTSGKQTEDQAGKLAAAYRTFGTALAIGSAAVAAATLAYAKASNEAGHFADEMQRIRDTARTIGLTTLQLQAVQDAGSDFALSAGSINQALTRLTANLPEARRATGGLFDEIANLNPEMALQLARTRSTAEALDVMNNVLNSTANEAERNKIAMTGFGRSAFEVINLLRAIAQAGGIEKLAESFRRSGDAIDDAMIKRVAQLKVEIDDMSGDARRNLASIFSERLLEMQHRSAESWRDISRSAREFRLSDDLKRLADWSQESGGFWDFTWWRQIAAMLPVIQELRTPGFLPPTDMQRARQDLARGLRGGERFDLSQAWIPDAPKIDQAKLSTEALYNIEAKRLALLGAAAPVADIVAQKEREITIAGIARLGVTDQQVKAILALTRAQALGTLAMRQAADTAQIEAQALGMGIGPATAYRLEHERLALARRTGQKLTEQDIEDIRKEASAAGGATAALERLRMMKDASFERRTLLLSEEDVKIAEKLRGIYGDDIPAALASSEAAAIRFNERMRSAIDMTSDISTRGLIDFKNELMNGTNAWESFRKAGANALNSLADEMIKFASKQAVRQIFGAFGSFGVSSGPVDLGSFVGGGLGGGPTGIMGIGPIAHGGGVIGQTAFPTRPVDMSVFRNAPSYGRGSLPFSIGGDEVPIIAHKKEVIGSPDQMRQAFGGGAVNLSFEDNRTITIGSGADKQTVAEVRALLDEDRRRRPAETLKIIHDAQSRRVI